jgi:SAM-dependent methyltransferase
MGLRQRAVDGIKAQFIHPRGVAGRAAGIVMAHRGSNRERNAWAVSLLDVQPHDRVLEVGCGPGLALRHLSGLATHGHVCGLDHSAVMIRQARRRNAGAIRRGLLELRLGTVADLDPQPAFDKILAVNVAMFWGKHETRLAELRRLLQPGGRIALVHQPRGPGASDETAIESGRHLAATLEAAGFAAIRVETLPLRPAVVCAVGEEPAEGRGQPSSGR